MIVSEAEQKREALTPKLSQAPHVSFLGFLISSFQSVTHLSAMGECLNKTSLNTTFEALEAACKWINSGVGGMTIQLELGVCHFAAAALLVCVGLLLAKKLLAKKRVYVLDFAVHKPHER